MMFDAATAPYPRQAEIEADEDGVGFGLRMATANGITFNELARALASPGHLYLPYRAASSLAFMFGCTPQRLGTAFVRRYFRGQNFGAEFLGHRFLRPYHLRQARPQVCPVCIQERAHALAAWSVSLFTACPEHGIRLLDHCGCGRRVSWRRPSIGLCECGRLLTPKSQPTRHADPRELWVSGQITYLLGPAHFRLLPISDLPDVFDEISVDTFVRLVWAFGVIDDQQDTDRPTSANLIPTTNDAARLVCRAYDRLSVVLGERPGKKTVRLAYSAIEALRSDALLHSDYQFVERLVLRLERTQARRPCRRALRTNSQIELFREDM